MPRKAKEIPELLKIADYLEAREALFKPPSNLAWLGSVYRDFASRNEVTHLPRASLIDMIRLEATVIIGEVLQRSGNSRVAEEWRKCFWLDLKGFADLHEKGTLLNPVSPLPETALAIVKDAEATLSSLYHLYLQVVVSHSKGVAPPRETVFTFAWLAGISAGAMFTRHHEYSARIGITTRAARMEAARKRQDAVEPKHLKWFEEFESMRRKDPGLSAHRAAPEVKRRTKAKEKPDSIRKVLRQMLKDAH